MSTPASPGADGLPVKVAHFQRADRWLFGPLCFVLTCWRKLRRPWGEPTPPGPPESILFVKLAEQGSTVLAVPALEEAIAMVGREHVYFAAFEENRHILDLLGLIPRENVLTVCTKSLGAMMLGGWTLLRRLRALRIGAAVDLEFLTRFSAALTYLSGAPRRAGLHCYFEDGPYRGDLMTHRALFNPHLHTSQTFRMLVDALKNEPALFPAFPLKVAETDLPEPSFTPEPAEVEVVRAMLEPVLAGKPDAPVVLLNPNASDYIALRRWPTGRYRELAAALLARFPEVRVVFTGLPAEVTASQDLVRAINSDRCATLAGRTTLRQLLVLYTLARVLVTNDSGPAHFAVLTPIHVVTLFGPETPKLFAARSPRNHVVYAGLACSPCVTALNNRQTACRDNLCMQSITVESVLATVAGLLEAPDDRRDLCPRFNC